MAQASNASAAIPGSATGDQLPADPASGVMLSFDEVSFDNFPKIFMPSEPDTWDHPNPTNRILLEFVRAELPRLLSLQPSLVVIPAEFPDKCPFPPGTPKEYVTGWEAEKKTFNAVLSALKSWQGESPDDLHIVCVHSLRYGCKLKKLKKLKVDSNWESDIDIAVLCFDNKTGRLLCLFLEVKSCRSARNLFQGIGKKGVMQLCTHLRAIQDHLGVDCQHVKPCLVLPNIPGPGAPKLRSTAEANVVQDFENFLKTEQKRGDPLFAPLTKAQAQLLTSLTLENPKALKTWLKNQTMDISDFSVAGGGPPLDAEELERTLRMEYSRILAWLLVHCVGAAVEKVTRVIHEQTVETVTKVALFTKEQNGLYKNPDFRPQVIIGAAGTGKTFVALHHLIKYEELGLINASKKGLFLTSEKNSILIAQVLEKLRSYDVKHIEVRAVRSSCDELKKELDNLRKELLVKESSDEPKFSHIVVDQMEDFPGFAEKFLPLLIQGEEESWQIFDMLWVMVDPYEMINMGVADIFFESIRVTNPHSCVVLTKRIRNSLTIGNFLDKFDSCRPLSANFPVEAAGHRCALGSPIFVEYFDKASEASSQKNVLAKTLVKLINGELGVRAEKIVIVYQDESSDTFWRELEEAMMEQFCEPKNRMLPSAAPLLVHAPMVGEAHDHLTSDCLNVNVRRLAEFVRQRNEVHHLSGFLQLKRELHYLSHAGRRRIFKGTDESISISFHEAATAALLRRFVAWADVKQDYTVLDTLKGALKSAEDFRHLLLKQTFVSAVRQTRVRGSEADVVLVLADGNDAMFDSWSDKPWYNRFIPRYLSRARVMAIFLFDQKYEQHINELFPDHLRKFSDYEPATNNAGAANGP